MAEIFDGTAEQLEPHLAALEKEGRASTVTASPPTVLHHVTQLERVLYSHGIVGETARLARNRKQIEKQATKLGATAKDAKDIAERKLRERGKK
jgi:hypothetical protein